MKEKAADFAQIILHLSLFLGKIKKHGHLPTIFDLLIWIVRDAIVFQLAVTLKNSFKMHDTCHIHELIYLLKKLIEKKNIDCKR